MLEPQTVADCIKEMEKAIDIPITVKCRLGVDNHDDYEFIYNFVKVISE